MFGRGAFSIMEFGAVEQTALPAPEVVLPLDWIPPLSRPTFRVPPYRTANQQFESFVQFAPFAESVSADRWAQPLSEPIRFKRRLPAHSQQFASFVQFAPFYEAVSADRWMPPLSEPVRFRKRLPTHAQQFASFVKASLFPEAVTIDRWQQPLSQPALRKRPLPIAAYPFEVSRSEWPVILNERMASMVATATMTGVSTAHYKQILNTPGARLIYTAIISPWSPSDRR
jgi:hypothetical protein